MIFLHFFITLKSFYFFLYVFKYFQTHEKISTLLYFTRKLKINKVKLNSPRLKKSMFEIFSVHIRSIIQNLVHSEHFYTFYRPNFMFLERAFRKFSSCVYEYFGWTYRSKFFLLNFHHP